MGNKVFVGLGRSLGGSRGVVLQLSGWSASEKVEIYSPSQLVFKLLYPAHGVSVVLFVQWA